ncbi:MAG: hypothetical protein AB1489_28375 [Acidobacteriota bacterium]
MMLRVLIVVALLLIATTSAAAQISGNAQNRPIFRINLTPNNNSGSIQTLDLGENFIKPEDSIIKLQRQVGFTFLPAGFLPALETETEPFKRRALRYAIGYYRDCEVPGLQGFFDVMVGMRFDTRNGLLEVRYFKEAMAVNPNIVQFPEDRSAFAVLPATQGSAMLFLLEGSKEQLFTFEGLFTENPRQVNFLTSDDVDGIATDEGSQKFAVFIRGGAERASLFVLNTDTNLQEVVTYEVLRDLPSTDRVYIFSILNALVPYRAANLK